MIINVDIGVVILFTVIIRDTFINFRDTGIFGDTVPMADAFVDILDEMIDYLKEVKEEE